MDLGSISLYFSSFHAAADAPDPEKAIFLPGQSSRTTHQATIAIDACKYLGALLVGAVNGTKKDELLSVKYSPINDYWLRDPLCPEIDAIAQGSFKEKNPPKIRGSGYAAESLEAALWAFFNSDSFEEGCLKAVNLGEDADTTGAVYGQLAGANYGEKAIPTGWQTKLALCSKIEELADQLYSGSVQR